MSEELMDIQGDNFGLLLAWVGFVLVVALSAWKGGNLAELAEHLDTMLTSCSKSKLSPGINSLTDSTGAMVTELIFPLTLRKIL